MIIKEIDLILYSLCRLLGYCFLVTVQKIHRGFILLELKGQLQIVLLSYCLCRLTLAWFLGHLWAFSGIIIDFGWFLSLSIVRYCEGWTFYSAILQGTWPFPLKKIQYFHLFSTLSSLTMPSFHLFSYFLWSLSSWFPFSQVFPWVPLPKFSVYWNFSVFHQVFRIFIA